MTEEHPFAPFVRILGKGKRGARDLTREEAREAFSMLLDERIEDVQLGAFLMLLRHKEETAEEMAGFTEAVRNHIQAPAIAVDIDWPTYAGKKRHLPWYLLAAKALAASGVRILMHGAGAHTAGRLYTEQLLAPLNIAQCRDWQDVELALQRDNLAFIPLSAWMPALQRMIDLRSLLGLRSPVHSLARQLNPLKAGCSLQSIFHPNYQFIHREAALLLGDHALIIKGEGGEIEVNPDSDCLLLAAENGEPWDETWEKCSQQRHVKPQSLDPELLSQVWEGTVVDDYAEQAIIATMALALRGLGMSRDDAFDAAKIRWQNRR